MVEANWTMEQALKAQRDWKAAGNPAHSLASPWFQWFALQAVDRCEASHIAGDPMALFRAIGVCAAHQLVLPEWAASAFAKGFDAVQACEAASWDEAFGAPYPKGFRRNDAKARKHWWPQILMAMHKAIIEDGRNVDETLFDTVGNRLGLGARQVRDAWYSSDAKTFRKRVDQEKAARKTGRTCWIVE